MSINLKINVTSLTIDAKRYKKRVYQKLRKVMESAALAFLKASATRVRVRTGFAHGAFGSLATTLGVSLPPGRQGTYPRGKEYYRGGGVKVLKTPSTGRTRATRIPFRETAKGMTFEYNISIDYFLGNDTVGHGRYGPWNAYKAGLSAFTKTFLLDSEEIFPDIQDFAASAKTNVPF